MREGDSSEELRLIADSAAGFASGAGGLARARAVRDDWPQRDRRAWQQIAGLGWLSMLVPERMDGMGLDVRALCSLQESVGRSLLPEPVAPAIAAAAFLAETGGDAGRSTLSRLVRGEVLLLPLPQPANAVFPLQLQHVADCYADAMLLLAYGAGEHFSVRLMAVEEVLVERAECVDGSQLGALHITQEAWARAPQVAVGPHAALAWDKLGDTLLLADAAYLTGAMRAALDLTLDYMKTRRQFGVPIGSFQALQQRAASAYTDCVASRALVFEACRAFDTPAGSRAACAAKARASAAALRVTKECVQFHGAIGFADEHDVGLYLRKAMSLAARDGGELQQKLRYAAMM